MINADQARDEIRKLPGSDGWFHPANEAVYLHLLDTLMARGMHPDDAVTVLGSAYGAAAAEFGA